MAIKSEHTKFSTDYFSPHKIHTQYDRLYRKNRAKYTHVHASGDNSLIFENITYSIYCQATSCSVQDHLSRNMPRNTRYSPY